MTLPRRLICCTLFLPVRLWFHMWRLFYHFWFLISPSFGALGWLLRDCDISGCSLFLKAIFLTFIYIFWFDTSTADIQCHVAVLKSFPVFHHNAVFIFIFLGRLGSNETSAWGVCYPAELYCCYVKSQWPDSDCRCFMCSNSWISVVRR